MVHAGFRGQHTQLARDRRGSEGTDLTPRLSFGAGFLPSQNPAWVLFEPRQKRFVSQRSADILVGTQPVSDHRQIEEPL